MKQNRRGTNRKPGAPALPGAGRPPKSATIREGAPLMISQIYPDGTANLGSGKATIRRQGQSRIVAIPQEDGSEIRILIF